MDVAYLFDPEAWVERLRAAGAYRPVEASPPRAADHDELRARHAA